MKKEQIDEEFDNKFDRLEGYTYGEEYEYHSNITPEIKEFIHKTIEQVEKDTREDISGDFNVGDIIIGKNGVEQKIIKKEYWITTTHMENPIPIRTAKLLGYKLKEK